MALMSFPIPPLGYSLYRTPCGAAQQPAVLCSQHLPVPTSPQIRKRNVRQSFREPGRQPLRDFTRRLRWSPLRNACPDASFTPAPRAGIFRADRR